MREPVGMESPRAYRNKMSLVVGSAADVMLGFYRQRSHELVPIDACPIVSPQLDDYVARLNTVRAAREVAPALRETRHLVARSARASGQAVLP